MAKGRSTPLLFCLVLLTLVPGVMNAQKEKDDIEDRIAVLYPDDVGLSAKILAKYIDLKHLLPYYTLIAQQQEFEAARLKLEAAQEAALYAKRDLNESLRGPAVVAASAMDPEEEGPPEPPELRDEKEKEAPQPETVKRPAINPDRLPPKQTTIHPYRLEEAAPEIAKHFTKEDLIKHWPK